MNWNREQTYFTTILQSEEGRVFLETKYGGEDSKSLPCGFDTTLKTVTYKSKKEKVMAKTMRHLNNKMKAYSNNGASLQSLHSQKENDI